MMKDNRMWTESVPDHAQTMQKNGKNSYEVVNSVSFTISIDTW